MGAPKRFMVFQTAFIGDVVLTLPLVQVLHEHLPGAQIDVVAIPTSSSVLMNHPAILEVLTYDKRGTHAGVRGIVAMAGMLRRREYDVAIVPHRSLRSAMVAWLGSIPRRIGFATSAGRFLFTDAVPYMKDMHEVNRNLSLLVPLGIHPPERVLPTVHPSADDRQAVTDLFGRHPVFAATERRGVIAIAPGSVRNTKRWPKEHYISLTRLLVEDGFSIVLVGSQAEQALCAEIRRSADSFSILNTAGLLSLLQSAELLRRCSLLVSNDSAPMHLAVSVRTPVIALFGPTIPGFGFAPLGNQDQVVEAHGPPCPRRPCSIHGGDSCPIKTFDCMRLIPPGQVYAKVKAVLVGRAPANHQHRVPQ